MKFAVVGAGAIGGLVATVVNDDVECPVVFFSRRATAGVAEYVSSTMMMKAKERRVRIVEGVNFTSDYSAVMGECDLVMLAVKCGATVDAVSAFAPFLKDNAVILSLQNGLRNVEMIREALALAGVSKTIHIYATMVRFNAVIVQPGRFVQTTSGSIVIDAIAQESAAVQRFATRCEGAIEVEFRSDIQGVQNSKLLINLINSVNALSGKPILEMLQSQEYRIVVAKAINEGLSVMGAASKPVTVIGTALNPQLTALVLPLPNWLFFVIANAMMKIDKKAKTSMLIDVENNVPTEVSFLNGEIVRLGKLHGKPTPVNSLLVELVLQTTQRNLPSQELLDLVNDRIQREAPRSSSSFPFLFFFSVFSLAVPLFFYLKNISYI